MRHDAALFLLPLDAVVFRRLMFVATRLRHTRYAITLLIRCR